MSLEIHFQGGAEAGKLLKFCDDIAQVTIGRDPARCQIVLPPQETKVGREHCSLRRELGRYRLILNKENQVLVNGKHVLDGHELGPIADLQLGVGGPVLVVKTSLAEGLAPTVQHVHQRGLTSIERDTERSARRGFRLAVAGVAIACLVGWFAYSKLWPEITKSTELTKQQQETLSNLTQSVAQHQTDEQRLQKSLDTAAASVYLVCQRDPSGNLEPSATAWVIDQAKGILATNGHVAKELDEAKQAGKQLVARSMADPPRDFVISSVKIHPGFDASMALWLNVLPERRIGALDTQTIDIPGNYCDVALMYVDRPDGLAAALPLAGDETVRAVTPGYLAGLVGYPMENVALGGVNLVHPTPTTQIAHVTAMTDYFGVSTGDVAERLLVQHSIPSAGGASGSPIVNADGQVVAINSAGNSITPPVKGAARIPSGVLINYGQRADLFRELLEGRADAAQAQRSARWKQDLNRYFQPLDQVMKDITAARAQQIDPLFAAFNLLHKTNLRLNALDAYEVKDAKSLFNYTGTISNEEKDKDGKLTGVFSNAQIFKVQGSGILYVGAIALSAPSLEVSVADIVDGKLQDIQADAMQFSGPWFPFRSFDVHDGEQIAAVVEGKPAPGQEDQKKFTLRAYLFPTGPYWTADMAPDIRAEGMAAQWVHSHLGWVDVGWKQKPVAQANGAIDEVKIGGLTLTSLSLPLKLTGGDLAGQEYLLVANAVGGQKIALSVYPAGQTTAMASDLSQQNPWAKCSISSANDSSVNAIVTGPKGTLVTVRAYTAGPMVEVAVQAQGAPAQKTNGAPAK